MAVRVKKKVTAATTTRASATKAVASTARAKPTSVTKTQTSPTGQTSRIATATGGRVAYPTYKPSSSTPAVVSSARGQGAKKAAVAAKVATLKGSSNRGSANKVVRGSSGAVASGMRSTSPTTTSTKPKKNTSGVTTRVSAMRSSRTNRTNASDVAESIYGNKDDDDNNGSGSGSGSGSGDKEFKSTWKQRKRVRANAKKNGKTLTDEQVEAKIKKNIRVDKAGGAHKKFDWAGDGKGTSDEDFGTKENNKFRAKTGKKRANVKGASSYGTGKKLKNTSTKKDDKKKDDKEKDDKEDETTTGTNGDTNDNGAGDANPNSGQDGNPATDLSARSQAAGMRYSGKQGDSRSAEEQRRRTARKYSLKK